MKKPILLLIVLFSITIYAQQKNDSDAFKLEFRLLNKNIKPYNFFNPQAPLFWAQVSLTNINAITFKTGKYLPFGWKGELYPFYLEAYALDGKEENLRFNGSYSCAQSPQIIPLIKGKKITDTLNIPVIYSFKNAGTYKLRAVFNTQLVYTNNKEQVNYGLIYSNWDTVYVKE